MNTTYRAITILLASAVTREKRELPAGFSLEEALPIIKKQHLIPLAFEGALHCGIPANDPVMLKLMQHYLRHLVHSEKQMRAVQQLFAAFEENKIDYLPLKGCQMKTLYPKPELRTMGDADILIREDQYDRVGPIMTALGFSMIRESLYDYEWRREDLMAELHRYLISPKDQVFHHYFGDGWNRAIRKTGCRYDFSPEDTLIYQFVHMTKHYQRYGVGSRHILDLYVYLRANPGLDESYIEEEMKKLHLVTFYRNIRRVLQVWFEDGYPDDVTEHITKYIFSGGSWGNLENGMSTEALLQSCEKGNIRSSRTRTLLWIVFPSATRLEQKYPVLKNAPWLLPGVWVFRWLEVLFLRRRVIRKKMHAATTMTDEKVLARQHALNYVGLDFGFGANEQA